ncbi:MAG: glycosyltransferase family 2 protein [Muribaculaceae bacterium]
MKRLTIIVPVYNAKRWLQRCVDSLLNQGLSSEDYEIILVDDGSKDGSPQICDDYAVTYPKRVRVMHQCNSGVSMARNHGIDMAQGEYMAFVDADDYVKENCFSEILSRCKDQQLDMCVFKMRVEDSNGSFREDNLDDWDYQKVYKGEAVIIEGYPVGSSCVSFFRSELISNNRLRFNPDLSFSEDADFVAHCLVYANRVGFMDIVPYVYAYNGASATNSPQKNAKKTLSCAEMASRLMVLSGDEKFSLKLRRYLEKWANSILVGHLMFLIKGGNKRLYTSFLDKAASLNLYPIKGRTKSWKTTLLIPFINCRWLIDLLIR